MDPNWNGSGRIGSFKPKDHSSTGRTLNTSTGNDSVNPPNNIDYDIGPSLLSLISEASSNRRPAPDQTRL